MNRDASNFRKERVEKLLHELRYEIERGMMEGDIDETLRFEFIVPISRAIPDGVVHCRLETRPALRWNVPHDLCAPRLSLVKGES